MTDPFSAVVETHISTVFFAGDRAYKLLKPVSMGFLDHTSVASRLHAARRELELNQGIAPDVYLGTADVVENGEVVDRMIVMRRLPSDRRLASLVVDGDAAECVRAVARTVAAFHARETPVADPTPATRDSVARNWHDNLDSMAPFADTVIPAVDLGRVATMADEFLEGRGAVFERRITDGWIRNGHGDLLADDIFCLKDGPRILDCLAFRDDLRVADVVNDVAFLAMDLERLAGSAAADDLWLAYREFSGERHPTLLAHHYVAYRAHVRTKVACLRAEQGDQTATESARRYHDLCSQALRRGRSRLVLVGGGAGVGKTTLARGVGDGLGAVVLHSDEIRKDLAGLGHGEHAFAEPGEGIYTPAMTDRMYREMLHQAAAMLEAGESVVLDATWSRAAHRELAADVARSHHAEVVRLECRLDPAIARERIARRMADVWNPSDATPELVDHLAGSRDPWPEATAVDMSRAAAVIVADTTALLLS